MILLLLFWLPLIFIASVPRTQQKALHRHAYCIGIGSSIVMFILIAFLIQPSPFYADTLKQYWYHFLFFDAVLPVLCVFLCYIPLSFLSTQRSCRAGASFLLGLLTIKIYYELFSMSNSPKLFPLAFVILTYTCAVLIYNAAAALALRFSFPEIIGYIIGSICFMLICALGFFAVALWYFQESVILRIGIFLLLTAAAPAALLAAALSSPQDNSCTEPPKYHS